MDNNRRMLLAVAEELVKEGTLGPGAKHYLYFDEGVTTASPHREPGRPGYLGRVYVQVTREVRVLEAPGETVG